MTLITAVKRKQIHTRKIICHGFLRSDGLWDIEAHLTDTKDHVFASIERGALPPGEAIHEMLFRLTLDEKLTIHDAQTETLYSPFSICADVNDWYKLLIGKQIAPGWNLMVKNLFAGVKGCTHLTELLSVMATTAIQTIYPYLKMQNQQDSGKFYLSNNLKDTCHGFDTKGKVIARFWPDEIND